MLAEQPSAEWIETFRAAGELLARLEVNAPNGSVECRYEKRTGVFEFRWSGSVSSERYGWQICVTGTEFKLGSFDLIERIVDRFRRELLQTAAA